MPPVDLLLASQNPGKLKEMRSWWGAWGFVSCAREIGILEAPPETGRASWRTRVSRRGTTPADPAG